MDFDKKYNKSLVITTVEFYLFCKFCKPGEMFTAASAAVRNNMIGASDFSIIAEAAFCITTASA
jgi:hypothetical protein